MNKFMIIKKILVSLAAVVVLAGCNKIDTPVTPNTNPPAVTTTPVTPEPPVTPDNVTPTPIKDALTTLFAQDAQAKESIYPKGTHLISVNLKDKLATVDVSKEFNQLQNKGESYEGAAQKKLCAALAPFSQIETMRLTVEGKDYESQAADWRKVPVRVSGESSESSNTSKSTRSVQSGGVQASGSVDR